MSKENRFLSSLSGFGIILVVLGHSTGVTEKMSVQISLIDPVYGFFFSAVVKWIFSFHMPLFFAISGFLYCYVTLRDGNVDPRKLVRSKFRRLLLPYLVISSVSFPVKALLARHALRPIDFNLHSFVHSLVFPWDNAIVYFWFLPTLFIIFMISAFTLQKESPPYYDFIIIAVSIFLWYVFPHHSSEIILNILNISGVFHNFIFFVFGFLVSKYALFLKIKKFNYIGIASALISLGLFYYYPSNKVSGLLMAISGIVLSVWICYHISNNKLAFLGDFAFHIYLFSWFPQVFVWIVFGQMFFINIWLSVFLSFLLGLMVPIVVVKLLNTVLNPKFRIFYGVAESKG